MKLTRLLSLGGAVLALTTFATFATGLDRRALWQVVQACVADYKLTGAPFPCLQVDVSAGEERGAVVVLPPLRQDMILTPTRAIVGVEDPFLQTGTAPNYFAAAWRARSLLAGFSERTPAREEVALIANSAIARDQDQLHIHVGCLRPVARRALAAAAPKTPLGAWTQIGAIVPHTTFWAMRVGSADLASVDPFRLAAQELAGKTRNLGELTVGVAGVRVAGEDQFLIFATTAYAPGSWWPVGAGDLLARDCAAPASPVR